MRVLDPMALPLSGTQLIEASAGTGKTYTITTLVLRLLTERGLDIDRILVVTFTEAAAAELRSRIRRRLRAALAAHDSAPSDAELEAWVRSRRQAGHGSEDRARLELALRNFDEAPISTIHGFCHRVLQDGAFETGVPFDTELQPDETPLLDQVVRDFWARELYDADLLFVDFLGQSKIGPSRLLRLAGLAARHPYAPVIPAAVELDEHPQIAPFAEAYARARATWLGDREEIQRLLLEHEGLHKRQYPKDELPAWFERLDGFFRHENPGMNLGIGTFEKFRASRLATFTTKAYQKRGKVPRHPFFDACEALFEAQKPLARNFELRAIDLKRRLIDYTRRELPRVKRHRGVQSFDDLLQLLHRAVTRHGSKRLSTAIRSRYQAALIDEFQDTDPIQYEIFEAIYRGSELPLFFIGDPKQAIYGFRGADVFAYLHAARTVGSRKLTMDRNWRSDPPLLEALEHLFDVRRPFMLEDIELPRVRPRPGAKTALFADGMPLPALEIAFVPRSLAGCPADKQIPREWADAWLPGQIAADISRLLHQGATIESEDGTRPVHPGDVAVLVRKNLQAQQIQTELRRLGIPSVVYGDASVLHTREADELLRVLSAVAEPTRDDLLRAALTTEMLGISGTELERMLEDDSGWNAWVESFRRWHAIWVERGFIQMFRTLSAETRTPSRLLPFVDGERRMTNLLHLSELLHTAATTHHLGPAGLLRWFTEERRVEQTPPEAVKLRLERDDRAVQLITIHRSKGLEYPIVYCPYLWAPDEMRDEEEHDLLFHDPEAEGRLHIDITIKPGNRHERAKHPNVAQARFETAAESLRLLYVALTRARHRAVVVWGAFAGAHHSSLGYLLHAPQADPGWAWDPDLVASKIKASDDEALLQWLETRRHRNWCVSDLGTRQPRPWTAPREASVPLEVRTPRAALDRLYRTSSFTQMTAKEAAGDGQDLDEVDERGKEISVAEPDAPLIPLATFPRGARAGNFFHDLFEHLDFQAPTEIERMVSAKLRGHGYDENAWLTPVATAVRAVLDTPLAEPGLKLADVPMRARVNELEFLLPVAHRTDRKTVLPRDLAEAFETHPDGLPPGYADRLRRLPFTPLRGFLKGFIDLVFEHEGRLWIVDYKTNHLGNTRASYDASALASVMAEHHYLLQAHLYTVAVLRHVRRNRPELDYDRDFGGVLYLFLRGMSPEGGWAFGVYRDKPPVARIEAISALLDTAHDPEAAA